MTGTKENKVEAEVTEKAIGRRDFVKTAALAGAGLAIASGMVKKAGAQESSEKVKLHKVVKRSSDCDLERMEKDLQRALKKPLNERHWIMVIDLRKCIGCIACTISCKAENRLPPGVVYRPVINEEIGKYPNVSRRHTPRPCMHCDKPPCVPVCPVNATKKRPDGIVDVEYNRCIGCRYCLIACPYSARTLDFGEFYTKGLGFSPLMPYEEVPTFEYNEFWKRQKGKSPVGNARKCHFCLHRIETGLLPQCVVTCLGGANYFGDSNDPNALVSEKVSKPNVMRLKEDVGTKPQVSYLI